MKRLGLLLAFLSICAFAQAGFLEVVCSNDADPDFDATHDWGFDLEGQSVYLIEDYLHLGEDSVYVDGRTNSDPDLSMTKEVTNLNGHIWTAYSLTIAGDGTFVSASSIKLPDVTVTPNQIYFTGGIVGIGEVLDMAFVVNVPSTGSFTFCLTQLPIPEPATMALLGFGGLALLRRKK